MRDLPKTVAWSVGLLFATHAVGLRDMVVLSRSLGVALWMPYVTLAVVYAAIACVLAMILSGRRWARILYTLVAAIGLLAVIGRVSEVPPFGWLVLAVKIAALALLHAPASNAWFDRARDGSSQAGVS